MMEFMKADICQIRTGKTQEELLKKFDIHVLPSDEKTTLTFEVKSFLQFDILISLLCSHRNLGGDKDWSFFFRGVSDKNFTIKSSLRVHNMEKFESQLISDMYARNPKMFQSAKNDFEMIAIMRHYGLPTRFIDFTRNPYVALWFACEGNKSVDGLVNLISSSSDVVPERMANILCKFARYNFSFDCMDVKYIYEYFGVSNLKYYLNMMWVYGAHMFFEPPKIDQREINQQSIFMGECNNLYRVFWDQNGQQTEYITRENYLAIANTYFDKLPKNIMDDHMVKGSLKSVDEYEFFNNIKIIIPISVKSEMIKELSWRGITKDYIYPTLENSVENLLERYKSIHGETNE